MPKTILVTGGAGYIGSHTCVELLTRGYEVVVVDNLSNSSALALERVQEITGKALTFYHADILDAAALDAIFAAHNIDGVIHFAGLKAVGESCAVPLRYYHNNVSGTITLLDAMQRHGVKNIIFSSSATVYGDPERLPLDEECRLAPTNPYGQTKLMIENILRDVHASDPSWTVTLLRYFNPVGAHASGLIGEDPTGIPNNLTPYIAQVAAGRLPFVKIFGDDYPTPDGTGVRDYIHVVDLALGHIFAFEMLTKPQLNVYNLGTGRGYSVMEVLRAFEKACGRKLPYEVVGRRSGDIAECFANPFKAKRDLGFETQYGIEEMMSTLWKWQTLNPAGFNR